MFGIRLPENFDRPYAARSVTEFWRRWHMSLSRWFRDYLYVPLGGNRGPAFQTYRNLVIVFLVTGLWHGANWTFVLWGAYHGILLLLERLTGAGRGSGIRPVPWQTVTVVLVVLGWVLFRAPTRVAAAG
jgi:alginate O-acetyltransferase complex protein AlgI